MRLIFDQNISHRILNLLPGQFKESTSVKKENLIDSSDRVIWDFAKINNFTIVTQDSDFNDLNSLYGFPPKIIWIRTGNLRNEDLANLLQIHFHEILDFLNNPNYGCFEILAIKK